MRAVQTTRSGDPDVLDVVDIPQPDDGPGQQLYDVSTARVNHADTHYRQGTRSGPSCQVKAGGRTRE